MTTDSQEPKKRRAIVAGYRLFSENQTKVASVFGHNEGTSIQNSAVAYSWMAATRSQGDLSFVWVGCGENKPTTPHGENKEVVNIHIESEELKTHFVGFCKGVIWPLFHYYEKHSVTDFSETHWQGYQAVNQLFADEIIKEYQEGDLIFIQDYHLMLVPAMIRKQLPNCMLGFFLHIPWPSSELYRSLPIRKELLLGLLDSDLIAFQTYAYARHFASACTRLLGLSLEEMNLKNPKGTWVRLECVPVGIDPETCREAIRDPATQASIKKFQDAFEGKKIIISRDRLEYIKGIPLKFKAFEEFLVTYPEYQGKVVLVQECRPNSEVLNEKAYYELVEEIEQLVGSINGRFGTISYTPIHYLSHNLKSEDTCALFCAADVAMITPLRDGMNVTTHEFTICQDGTKMGPIILSEFAGSAHCLSGALLVNPWDQREVIKTLKKALEMSEEQKKVRHKHNYDYVVSHDAVYWIDSFLKILETAASKKDSDSTVSAVDAPTDEIVESYRSAKQRLFLLDYDGTLTPIAKVPKDAIPKDNLLKIVSELAKDPKNIIYVISGRDRETLAGWFKGVPIGFSCEHGCFFKHYPGAENIDKWEDVGSELDLSWKNVVQGILDDYADRVPGSFVESKEICLTWHYRNSDEEFAENQKNELVLHLQSLAGLPIDILLGKKAVEARPQGIHKGSVVKRILSQSGFEPDFVLCMGDDTTDEDMFTELRDHPPSQGKYSITVGKKPTSAQYFFENQSQVPQLLEQLTKTQ
eukprot:TRINITY_DN5266_c0_g1_i1.p1 TRINITY_DN5266_c0_g1~~TRINITY_DN5266_c0_g1_i1.p1  ORF type:complete len:754 (+),score=270.25 TRINITY_DN5266_c0_g1_i1:33-2294(+)